MFTVYSKKNCPNCVKAKKLLDEQGCTYNVVFVDEDTDARNKLINMGLKSVPQVFRNNTLVPNGYQGLLLTQKEGVLNNP